MVHGYGHLVEAIVMVAIRGNFFEMQLGGDYQFKLNYADVYAGSMFNYTRNMLQGDNTNIQSDGFGPGGYASMLFHNGFYLDSVLRYVRYINNTNISFVPSGGAVIPMRNNSGINSLIFSVEGGYRYMFMNAYYIENHKLNL